MNYINGAAGTYNKPTSVVASGSITQTNNRGDYTATNAFYWANGLDLSAYQDGRHFLTIYDSGVLSAGGFISATAPVGDGAGNELLGSNLVTNPSMETGNPPSNWVNNGTVTTREQSNTQAHSGTYSQHIITQNVINQGSSMFAMVAITANKLYYGGGWLYLISGANIIWTRYSTSPYPLATLIGNEIYTIGSWQLSSSYAVASSTASEKMKHVTAAAGITEFYADDGFLNEVTDPPPTGVRIVSTKGGVTRAWTWKNSSFNPNTACSYTITYVGN